MIVQILGGIWMLQVAIIAINCMKVYKCSFEVYSILFFGLEGRKWVEL